MRGGSITSAGVSARSVMSFTYFFLKKYFDLISEYVLQWRHILGALVSPEIQKKYLRIHFFQKKSWRVLHHTAQLFKYALDFVRPCGEVMMPHKTWFCSSGNGSKGRPISDPVPCESWFVGDVCPVSHKEHFRLCPFQCKLGHCFIEKGRMKGHHPSRCVAD